MDTNSNNPHTPHTPHTPGTYPGFPQYQDMSSKPLQIGNKYIWPRGLDGVPLRTTTPVEPLIKSSEISKLRLAKDAHVEVLRLGEKKDLDRYKEILQLCCVGWAEAGTIERRWVEEDKNWVVLIEYVTYYSELPDDLYNRVETTDDILRIG